MKQRLVFSSILAMAVICMVFPEASRTQDKAPAPAAERLTNDPKGAVAPEFDLKVLPGDGKTLKLSELKGKVVLLNFWATWCEPCKVEMPWFRDLQKKYGPQGLQVVGVALDDTGEDAIISFSKKMGVNYTILQGTDDMADMYGGVEGLPESFFIDRSGKVAERKLGLASLADIEAIVKKLLETKASPALAAH